MPPDVLHALLRSVRRRRMALDVVIAIAVSLAIVVTAWAAGQLTLGVLVAIAAAAIMLAMRRGGWTLPVAARAIERARPACRNLVITAEELQRHPERASGWMVERVRADAGRAVADLRPSEVVSARRAAAIAVTCLAVAAAIALVSRTDPTSPSLAGTAKATLDRVLGRGGRVTIQIQPPEYSRLAVQTVTDPDRLDVLEGTRLTVASAAGGALRLGFRTVGTLDGGANAEIVARESGYLAIDPADASAPRRLIALAVRRDAAPAVRIEAPAKDLLLPDSQRTIPVSVSAADDLAIVALELRYTRVSGGGETFEFQEGTLPLRISRPTSREWRADAELALRSLKLAPGESLVYHAVARDARAGEAGVGRSDTFFVEIAGPGQVALEGVDMPPQEERYALSQQMIVLKIERLRARQASMTREALVEETTLLAAEQRTVRANFVFLLGGHVEDEEVEAEQSHEIAEGRLQNTARREINRAIGDMTRAEQGLVATSPSTALPPAKSAVEALQRAFGKSRYLLRTLPVRSRIDPSRRLSGALAGARPWERRTVPADLRPGNAARWMLTTLNELAAALETGNVEPSAIEQVAESALAVDPQSAAWQDIARQIMALRGTADASARVRALLPRVAAEAAAGLVPQTPLSIERSPLERAWRKGGTR